MHNHIPSRSAEEITHLGEADLIACEDEDIQDDIPTQYSLHEGVIILFG